MADTVDTAASLSPANEADRLDLAPAADEADRPDPAPAADEADKLRDATSTDEAKQPDAPSDGPQDEAEQESQEREESADTRSVTELLEQLGHEMSDLGVAEAQLEAARNMPEVRRSARDIAGALIVAVAALTAFAFFNVAAMDALSKVLAAWLAALVLAAAWLAIGGVLLFGLMGRARRWLLWIALKEPPRKAVEELERERDAAGRAARSTAERLGPALAIQIALAAVPDAGDVASGVVEVGDTVLDASDEIVEEITEELPGGGAVNQVWSIALMPGRFGIRIATTVLRRGKPAE